MAAFLYHKKSGDFYIYTSALAKRDDVELIEADDLAAAKELVAARESDESVKAADRAAEEADAAALRAIAAAEAAERAKIAAAEKAAKAEADKAEKAKARAEKAAAKKQGKTASGIVSGDLFKTE